MANTCESVVRITGLLEHISAFRGLHFPNGSDGDLDTTLGLNKMRELHPDYAHVFSDAGAWVSDWTCDEVGQSGLGLDAQMTMYVDSRWNEPIDWLQGIIFMHPELTFDITWAGYEDQFVGELHGSGGVVTKHQIRCDEDLTDEDKFVLGMIDSLDGGK
jgi:hypothetical protein